MEGRGWIWKEGRRFEKERGGYGHGGTTWHCEGSVDKEVMIDE